MFREHLAGGFTHHQGAVFIYRAGAEPPAEGAAKGPWAGSLVLASGRVSSGIRTGSSQNAGRQSFSYDMEGEGAWCTIPGSHLLYLVPQPGVGC